MRIRFVAVAAFNALLLVSLNSYAAGGGGIGGGGGGIGGGGTPPAVGGRYPIGAPPSSDSSVIEAYQFRSRMSADPQCQTVAQEADKAFGSEMDTEQKTQQLNQLKARAQQLGCLQ
jgi:hypothetical protein